MQQQLIELIIDGIESDKLDIEEVVANLVEQLSLNQSQKVYDNLNYK
jgi:hypothetical protein